MIATPALHAEMRQFLAAAVAPRRRSLRDFAEAEIVIPNGPFDGRRFSCRRQPYTAAWFDLVDSKRWRRHFALGPTQSGKTLCAFVIPICYYLFEMNETVLIGLPDLDMAKDKWLEDILPVLARTRYASFLPRGDGRPPAIRFRNGVTLRFMSGGGGDKSRSAFTSRILMMTEVDGLDQRGGTSREADKIKQLEGRTRAFGNRAVIFGECTVSVEQGRTWQEYQRGTCTDLYLPCPHCGEFVRPERDQLVGWQDAQTKIEARNNAAFVCSACGELWSEAQRAAANAASIALHAGQTLDKAGNIQGEPRDTDTLSFRWSAVHNQFQSAGDVGADEWRSAREEDEDNAEREMNQFVWTLPHKSPEIADVPLVWGELVSRQIPLAKGYVPADADFVTLGIDIGKYLAHWVLIAWYAEGSGHIADYGRFEIPSDQLGVEAAILAALREFRDVIFAGWAVPGAAPRVPDQVWIDAKWQSDKKDGPKPVYAWCRETNAKHPTGGGDRFRPCRGHSATQQRKYKKPSKVGAQVRFLGDGFHIEWRPAHRVHVVEIDSDAWKTWAHGRLAPPLFDAAGNRTPGTISLHKAMPRDHQSFARHLTAEKMVREFVAGMGEVIRWEQIRKQNHWLDCVMLASGAAWLCGVRIVPAMIAMEMKAPAPPRPAFTTPDGRPYLVTERE